MISYLNVQAIILKQHSHEYPKFSSQLTSYTRVNKPTTNKKQSPTQARDRLEQNSNTCGRLQKCAIHGIQQTCDICNENNIQMLPRQVQEARAVSFHPVARAMAQVESLSPKILDERFQSTATSYAIFFPRFILHIFFSSFCFFMVILGVGFWGLGFSVHGVWGPWSGPFWFVWGWGSMHKHRRINLGKKLCHSTYILIFHQASETLILDLCRLPHPSFQTP